ncbi:galactose-1-phosphate uridylyltransferase [Kwoniella sp. CBS 9459]
MTQALGSEDNLAGQRTFRPNEHVHRRFNPLLGKHILVSPHRSLRPWHGQTEETSTAERPSHDPACYLCPGNKRSTGEINPNYNGVYVFDNGFPALLPDSLPVRDPEQTAHSPFFQSEPVRGRCRVICFHPRHDLSMASMKVDEIGQVLDSWKQVYEEEGRHIMEKSSEGCVQIFENRGAMMGCSAPHPHGQVWTTSFVPDEPAAELANFARYTASNHPSSHLLLDYAAAELKAQERVVSVHESGWLAVVPFWASWPFEVLIIPSKRHIPSLLQMTSEERLGLASIMKDVLGRYDNLFSCPFPYSMGLHQSPLPPADPSSDPAQLHLHFYPPLLRSATIRKFMVGFELMGEAQRDIPPEQAASRLRASSM